MMHFLPWAAALGMAVYHYHLVLCVHLTLVSRFRPEDMLLDFIGYPSGIILAAVVIDLLAARKTPPDLRQPARHAGSRYRLAVLLFFPAYALATRFALFHAWLDPVVRALAEVGEGFLVAVSH